MLKVFVAKTFSVLFDSCLQCLLKGIESFASFGEKLAMGVVLSERITPNFGQLGPNSRFVFEANIGTL